MFLDSSDLCYKMNRIFEKIYFDSMSDCEKRFVLNKLLCDYTSNILSGTGISIPTNDFSEMMNIIDSNMFKNYYRNDFYNNYTKFFIGLIGREQGRRITWMTDKSVDKPLLKDSLGYGMIDAIITNDDEDSLTTMFNVYELYGSYVDKNNSDLKVANL